MLRDRGKAGIDSGATGQASRIMSAFTNVRGILVLGSIALWGRWFWGSEGRAFLLGSDSNFNTVG